MTAGREFSARTGLRVLLAVYVVARVVQLLGGRVFVGYDSASYARRGDPALDIGPILSFTGHAPRLWGVPVFYAVLGTDTARTVAQWTISTIAWALLAWVVASLLHRGVVRLVAAGAVLLLALVPPIANWDFAILSESASISLGVLALALLLRWSSTGSRLALGGAVATAFWWTFTRPDIRVYTVSLIAALALVAWRWPERRRPALIAAGVLVLAVGWASAIMPAATQAGKAWSGLGASRSDDEWLIYRLRVQVLPDPAVKRVFTEQLGMPSCPAAEAIATRPDWDILEFADAYENCPALAAWGAQHRTDAFNRFAVAAPGQYLRVSAGLVGQSWQGATYATVPGSLLVPVRKLVFPSLMWTLPLILVGMAVSVAAALVTGARAAHPRLFWAAAGVGAASFVSTIAAVLYGTGEFARFGIQEAIGMRLSILLFAAIAIDEFLIRRAERAAVSSARTTLNVGSHASG